MSQSTHAADDHGTETLTETERHQLLSASKRRTAVSVLTDRSVPIGLRELATVVAAETTDSETLSEDTLQRTAAHLHHQHLPLMDDLNVIDYNTDTNTVESCNVCPAALLD